MTGRIRPGIYVLGLIRLRTYGILAGHIGDMTPFGWKWGSYQRYASPRHPARRSGFGAARGPQSPSGFRSKR